MRMYRIDLIKKIKDYGFAAVIEVSSAARYARFVEREARKRNQARYAKEFVLEAFNHYEIQRAQEAKESLYEHVPEKFQVVSGIGLLTTEMPVLRRGGLDFFLSVYKADAFTFFRACQHTLKHIEMEENERTLAKQLIQNSDKINLVELMKKNENELNAAAEILGMDISELATIFRKVSGNIAESYFHELFSEYLSNFTILPQVKRYFKMFNKNTGKYLVRETDTDLIVACPEVEFYDSLYMMARTQSIGVDYNPEVMRMLSGFFTKSENPK